MVENAPLVVGSRVVHIPTGQAGVVVRVYADGLLVEVGRVACDNGDVAIRPSDEWEEETR